MGKRVYSSALEKPLYILISVTLLSILNEYEPNCISGCLKEGAKAALKPFMEQLLELFKWHWEGNLNIRDRGKAVQINPKSIQAYDSVVKAWSMI